MFRSIFMVRHLPDLLILIFVLAVQTACAWAMLRRMGAASGRRRWVGVAWGVSACLIVGGLTLMVTHESEWAGAMTTMYGFLVVTTGAAWGVANVILQPRAHYSPARRQFLTGARYAVLAAPTAAIGYGVFIQRFNIGVREQSIRIPGLPKDLDGLRIAQLTDIHLSPFLSLKELERAVDLANETRPHLTLVTGDLITERGDPLDDCMRALTRLKSDAGIFGCMGNHEIYARCEAYVQLQAALLGMSFLRQQAQLLRFGGAVMNLAGVDYQRLGRPYLRGAEKLVAPGTFNVLLSHNPDVFPVAAAKGFPLTFSGHTHGGQVRVEILGADFNIARFFTPYVDGLYQESGSSIFVSRGIGTIGLPARLGAPPEVALVKLCRS